MERRARGRAGRRPAGSRSTRARALRPSPSACSPSRSSSGGGGRCGTCWPRRGRSSWSPAPGSATPRTGGTTRSRAPSTARAGCCLTASPRSFFVSFPAGSLVTHPYRERFHNELLPKLHADLWSDWYGQFHPNNWGDSTRLDRATASTQSVLGLAGDALAIGGLAAIGVPALLRTLRRRGGRESDGALALLSLVTVVAFAAFVIQIVRYPQIAGVEIKASYLLFLAPCFAVFSVAAWLAVARWRRQAGIALVVAAVLYAFSYGTSLAAVFSGNYDQQPRLAPPHGYVDLKLTLQGPNGKQWFGSEADYTFFVENVGTRDASNVALQINLAPGMQLLGPPYYETGPGCVGTREIDCPLDFLAAGKTSTVRLAVRVMQSGAEVLTARANAYELDARPVDNTALSTLLVTPG